MRYSHSEELVSLLAKSLGEDELEAFLQCDNAAPETTLQTNTLRCTADEALAALEAEGVEATAHPWLPGCFTISGSGDGKDLFSLPSTRYLPKEVSP